MYFENLLKAICFLHILTLFVYYIQRKKLFQVRQLFRCKTNFSDLRAFYNMQIK